MIAGWDELAVPCKQFFVAVPIGVLAIGLAVEGRDKVYASLHQAAGQEQTLAEPIAAVAITQLRRLLRQVKQAAYVGRGQQSQRAISIRSGTGGRAGQGDMVQATQQGGAVAQISGSLKRRNAEVGGAGIAVHLEAIIGSAQQTGRLPRQLHHVVQRVRQSDIRQDTGARAEGVADGRAKCGQAARIVGE